MRELRSIHLRNGAFGISIPVIRPWPRLVDGVLANEAEKWGEVFLRVLLKSTEAIREFFDPRPMLLAPIECCLPWRTIRRLGYTIEGEPQTREAPAVMVFNPQVPAEA